MPTTQESNSSILAPVDDINYTEFFKFCSQHMNLVQKFCSSRACMKECALCDQCKKHEHNFSSSNWIDVKTFLKMVKQTRKVNHKFGELYLKKKIPSFQKKVQQSLVELNSEILRFSQDSSLIKSILGKSSKQFSTISGLIFCSPKAWKMQGMTCDTMSKFQELHKKCKTLNDDKLEEIIEQQIKYVFTKFLLSKEMLHLGLIRQVKKQEEMQLSYKQKDIKFSIVEGDITEVAQKLNDLGQRYRKIDEEIGKVTVDISLTDEFLERSEEVDETEENIESENLKLNILLNKFNSCLETKKITNFILDSKIPASNSQFWDFFYTAAADTGTVDAYEMLDIQIINQESYNIFQTILQLANKNARKQLFEQNKENQVEKPKKLSFKKYQNQCVINLQNGVILRFRQQRSSLESTQA